VLHEEEESPENYAQKGSMVVQFEVHYESGSSSMDYRPFLKEYITSFLRSLSQMDDREESAYVLSGYFSTIMSLLLKKRGEKLVSHLSEDLLD